MLCRTTSKLKRKKKTLKGRSILFKLNENSDQNIFSSLLICAFFKVQLETYQIYQLCYDYLFRVSVFTMVLSWSPTYKMLIIILANQDQLIECWQSMQEFGDEINQASTICYYYTQCCSLSCQEVVHFSATLEF